MRCAGHAGPRRRARPGRKPIIETNASLCDKGTMKTVNVECPDQLHEQLAKLVAAGWFKSPEEGVLEALRRYLSGHSVELQERQIMADVEWGLHGRD